MFRKMLRSAQQLPTEECLDLLIKEPRGVLSVLGDGGYPYGFPMNHWYCEEDGCLYFHCGLHGHKLDALRAHDRVSFCVYDQGYRREGEWALNIRSVIVFGRIEIISDIDQVSHITHQLSLKYTDDLEYIRREIRMAASHTLCLRLRPEHITGKLVNES